MTEKVVTLSESDTARFGMRIARARFDHDTGHREVIKGFDDLAVDLLVLRLPAGSHQAPRALAEAGFRVIHADTLVYYQTSLSSWVHGKNWCGEASFSRVTSADVEGVQAVARNSFRGYRSHYQATPSLDADLVSEGYAEWAARYASTSSEDRLTYVVRSGGVVVGFVASSLDKATRVCDVVLNAVVPEHEGRGLYREALGRVMTEARSEGFQTGTISTQIWNYRVQRVWTRCGMHLTHAYDTYHVSRSAQHTAADKQSRPQE